MNFRKKLADHSQIIFNVTSMVDVLLVLVLFLLLTWSTAQVESELGIQLPSSTTAPQQSQVRSPVVVNVRGDGKVTVNKREMGDEAVRDLLAGMIKLDPRQTVILRADKAVPYDRILDLLDVCNQAGVASVGFGALPAKAKPDGGV